MYASMHVCMDVGMTLYVYMYVCMYARMYVCMYGRVYACIEFLLTIEQLEDTFSRANVGKSPGPVGLPDDMFEYFGTALSRLYYPLSHKAAARGQAPLQQKGGLTRALYKGKKKLVLVVNNRAISTASAPAKHNHGMLRTKLFNEAHSYLLESQTGGRPGVGTDMRAMC